RKCAVRVLVIKENYILVFCIDAPSIALLVLLLFFFSHTPPTEIYTHSLHDALPISTDPKRAGVLRIVDIYAADVGRARQHVFRIDRKSTRLNSSHVSISYAVFCLKKKTSIASIYLEIIVANAYSTPWPHIAFTMSVE